MKGVWWLGAAAVAAALGAACQRHAERRDARAYCRPGHLVRVEGRLVHVVVDGAGDPPVVIVSGLGGCHLEWEQVVAGLSGTARVVRYDRAGFAFTPFFRGDRRPSRVAGSLREMLAAEGIAPPFVLVGHSLGRLYVCAYAALFPQDVAGAVLVDPTHEDVMAQTSARVLCHLAGVAFQIAAMLARCGPARLYGRVITLVDAARLVDPRAPHAASFLAAAGALTHRTVGGWRGLAEEYRGLVSAHLEMGALAREHGFPAAPLTVISAGRGSSNPVERRAWTLLRTDLHRRIAALSPFGRHVVAEGSGHLVPLDDPGTVIDEVRAVHRRLAPR